MHVAYVCADRGVPVFGRKGCSIHVQEILRAMLQRGWTVDLFASQFGGKPAEDLRDVRVHQLPTFIPKETGSTELQELVFDANRCLNATLDEHGPFDLIYERYSLWSFAAQEFACESGTPSVLEVNAPLIEEQSRYRTLPEPELADEVAARTFTAATSLVAVSEEVADYLRTRPEAAGRVHVVANGVSAERFGSINRRPLSYNDVFTIGFVGSLKPWHGVEILIDAFAHVSLAFPDVRLQIVGDGPERAALQKRVEQQMPSRIDMVEFLGAVDHDRVPELLASMDVAVAPYPQLDGFYFSPLKIYEYMAAGCAVIASRIGAPARIISSGVNGLLFEPGNVDGLTATLRTLYCNRGLCRELGNAARREVLRQQTWQHVLEAIVAATATGTRKSLTEVAT